MAELAIFIKTIFRETTLFNCVNSIENHVGDISYRLYIADDGDVSASKRKLYDRLIKEGHVIVELPLGTGASKSRNVLLKHLKDEKYVLRMDDDFEFVEETNIAAMIAILNSDSQIGAVADLEKQIGDGKGVKSGEINPLQGFLEIKDNILTKKIIPLKRFKYITYDGYKYAFCDLTRNMILLKREMFQEVKWEDDLKFQGEHTDFLLQIKNSSKNIVFTIDSIHYHRDDLKPTDNTYHSRNELSNNLKKINIYREKWGVVKIKEKGLLFHRLTSEYKRNGFMAIVKKIIKKLMDK